MSGQHRESGGKRAVEAKHRERDAKRPEGYAESETERYARFFVKWRKKKRTPTVRLERNQALLEMIAERALLDPGVPIEQRREQAIRACQTEIKALDPLKIIAELGEDLRQAHADIESLKEQHAAQVSPGDPGGPEAAED